MIAKCKIYIKWMHLLTLISKRGLSLIFFKYKLTAEKNLLHLHGLFLPSVLQLGIEPNCSK